MAPPMRTKKTISNTELTKIQEQRNAYTEVVQCVEITIEYYKLPRVRTKPTAGSRSQTEMNDIMHLSRISLGMLSEPVPLYMVLLAILTFATMSRMQHQLLLAQVARLIHANKTRSENSENPMEQDEIITESNAAEITERLESDAESDTDESAQESTDSVAEPQLTAEAEEQTSITEPTEPAEPTEPLEEDQAVSDAEVFEAIFAAIGQILNTLITTDAEGNKIRHLEIIQNRLQKVTEEHDQLVKQLDAAPLALYSRFGRVEQLANESIEQSTKLESQLDAILQGLAQSADAASPYESETIAVQDEPVYIEAEPVYAAQAYIEAEPVLAPVEKPIDVQPQYRAYNPAHQTANGAAPQAPQYQAYRPNLNGAAPVLALDAKDETVLEADMPNFDDAPGHHNLDDQIIDGPAKYAPVEQLKEHNNLGWPLYSHEVQPLSRPEAVALFDHSKSSGPSTRNVERQYYMNSSKILCFEEASEAFSSPNTSDDVVVGVAEIVHMKPKAAPVMIAPDVIVNEGDGDEPSGRSEGQKDIEPPTNNSKEQHNGQPPAEKPEGGKENEPPVEQPEDDKTGKNDPAPSSSPVPSSSGSSSLGDRPPVIHEFPLILDCFQKYRVGQLTKQWNGENGDLIRSHGTDHHRIYRIVAASVFGEAFRVQAGKRHNGGVGFIIDPQALSRLFYDALQMDYPLSTKTLEGDWLLEKRAGGSFNDIYFIRHPLTQTRLIFRVGADTLDWQPADILQFLSCIKLTKILAREQVHVADTIGHSRMPMPYKPPIDFTVERQLLGIPAYLWWNVQRDTMEARRAILDGYAREVAKIHRAKMYAYSMGRLDESIANDHVPTDGWPVKSQIIYYRTGREEQYIGLGMLKGHGRQVREEGRLWDDSHEWRFDCFTRWLEQVAQPWIRGGVPEEQLQRVHLSIGLLYTMIARMDDRRSVDTDDGKEKFHLGHVDLGYQNVLAQPLYVTLDKQVRVCELPHKGPGGSEGNPLHAHLSIIDWDDAKFLPKDRGYLSYPPWLYKRHYALWLDPDAGHPDQRWDSEAMYDRHRKEYRFYLERALGADAHLARRWTTGSHWAAVLDDALQMSLCVGVDRHQQRWMFAPFQLGQLIWQKFQTDVNISPEELKSCETILKHIGSILEQETDSDDVTDDFVRQFPVLFDQLLDEKRADKPWVYKRPTTADPVAVPAADQAQEVAQELLQEAIECPLPTSDAPAELEDTAFKPEAVAEESKAVAEEFKAAVEEPQEAVELPADIAEAQPKDTADKLADLKLELMTKLSKLKKDRASRP